MVEPTTIEIIAQLGAIGMSALAVVIVSIVVYRTRPNQDVQLKLIGVLQTQGETAEKQSANAERLRQQLELHDTNSTDRDNAIVEFMKLLKTGQMTILTATETISKNILATNKLMSETAEKMTSDDISGKLDRALALLEGIDQKLNNIDQDLESTKKEVAVVKKDVQDIQKAQTGEHPSVANHNKTEGRAESDTPAQHDAVKTNTPHESSKETTDTAKRTHTVSGSPAPVSKSQARQTANNGNGKSDDNDEDDDKEVPPDPVPRGG
jgi:hypothetical protein